MDRSARILITGASGMVGAATLKLFEAKGYTNISSPTRNELDLLDQAAVLKYFDLRRPEYVFMIAAKVGGIAANLADPVGFLDQNMRMTLNLFAACHRFRTRKNLFLGSSCIYPRECRQPMRESDLLTGPLEVTNEAYALAKITGLKLAAYYEHQYGLKTVCLMPCNIYGSGDHFDLQNSHVLSSLVRRFVDARDAGAEMVTLWGTGQARREFLHVDDVALAILFFINALDNSKPINVGSGSDVSILELANLIACHVGFKGGIHWDKQKPDGMPRKCLDVSEMTNMGFRPAVSLGDGILRMIKEYETYKSEGLIKP